MNYRILIIISLFLYSCTTTDVAKKDPIEFIQGKIYSNKGFALLYNEDLKKQKLVSKKIEDRTLIIFQSNLKKNTDVKITNLLNNKSILAKVGANSKYPKFYNSVISKRIYDELELNESQPYVEITTISANSTFLAKKAKMYEEEKKVAEKAPVDGISISDISLNTKKNKKKQNIDKFNYIIKIAEFYYKKTAIMLQNRLENELKVTNVKIEKISKTSFRVYLGPFDNLKTLKNAFDGIIPLNFENIEIVKK